MSNKNASIIQSKETAQSIESALNGLTVELNPDRIKTAYDAQLLIKTAERVNGRASLINYRAMYIVHRERLWAVEKDEVGKPYKSYVDWCNRTCGINRTQAYNAVKVGHLIKSDGTGTTLPRIGTIDFTFTQLVAIVGCKNLFEEIENDDGEKEQRAKLVEKKVKRYDEKGNQAWGDCNGVGRMLYDTEKELLTFNDGKEHEIDVYEDVIEALARFGIITPQTSVKQINAISKKEIKVWEFGVDLIDPPKKEKAKAEDEDESEDTTEDEDVTEGVQVLLTIEESEYIYNLLKEYSDNSELIAKFENA